MHKQAIQIVVGINELCSTSSDKLCILFSLFTSSGMWLCEHISSFLMTVMVCEECNFKLLYLIIAIFPSLLSCKIISFFYLIASDQMI